MAVFRVSGTVEQLYVSEQYRKSSAPPLKSKSMKRQPWVVRILKIKRGLNMISEFYGRRLDGQFLYREFFYREEVKVEDYKKMRKSFLFPSNRNKTSNNRTNRSIHEYFSSCTETFTALLTLEPARTMNKNEVYKYS